MLLLASLHSRSIHITGVSGKRRLGLIIMAKEKELNVTCDVSIYALFLSQADFHNNFLPTKEDQNALWNNLKNIDCFSIGALTILSQLRFLIRSLPALV